MSKQKNNEVLKYNEPVFAGAGDYLIPLIKLQPVEEVWQNAQSVPTGAEADAV